VYDLSLCSQFFKKLYANVSINNPQIETFHLSFQALHILQSLLRFLFQSIFLSFISFISGLGFVVFQLHQLFVLGNVKLQSLFSKQGTTSKIILSLNGTIITCPSAFNFVIEYVFSIDIFTACNNADCQFQSYLSYCL